LSDISAVSSVRGVSFKSAVVEVAGRDSIAAAIKSCKDWGFNELIPTYAYTGTEWGESGSIERAVARLRERLPDVRVHDLVFLRHEDLWHALNGRFISELISRYGFYSPCIGCHLYLHAVRIPMSLRMGALPIIAGERLLHENSIKINQTQTALLWYQTLAKDFGIELLLPLKDISSGKIINEILGIEWEQGKEQPGCVLSGNYKRLDGSLDISEEQVGRFLGDFAVSVARRAVKEYVSGLSPDPAKIAADVLKREGF